MYVPNITVEDYYIPNNIHWKLYKWTTRSGYKPQISIWRLVPIYYIGYIISTHFYLIICNIVIKKILIRYR